jgi:hypothetical protein
MDKHCLHETELYIIRFDSDILFLKLQEQTENVYIEGAFMTFGQKEVL